MTSPALTREASAVALLRAAMDRSGLNRRQFAEDVMVRTPSTIRRWITGEIPIPVVAVKKLWSLVDAQAVIRDDRARERR